MIVFPKREVLTIENITGVYLSLYDKENNLLIRSQMFKKEDHVISVNWDGLVYCFFNAAIDTCCVTYQSLLKKFNNNEN